MGDDRRASAPFERDPDIGRKLRPDPVKSQRRQQADHTTWYGARGDNEGLMFGDRTLSKPILATGDPVEHAVSHESRNLLAMDASTMGVLRGHDAPPPCQREQASLVGSHV